MWAPTASNSSPDPLAGAAWATVSTLRRPGRTDGALRRGAAGRSCAWLSRSGCGSLVAPTGRALHSTGRTLPLHAPKAAALWLERPKVAVMMLATTIAKRRCDGPAKFCPSIPAKLATSSCRLSMAVSFAPAARMHAAMLDGPHASGKRRVEVLAFRNAAVLSRWAAQTPWSAQHTHNGSALCSVAQFQPCLMLSSNVSLSNSCYPEPSLEHCCQTPARAGTPQGHASSRIPRTRMLQHLQLAAASPIALQSSLCT